MEKDKDKTTFNAGESDHTQKEHPAQSEPNPSAQAWKPDSPNVDLKPGNPLPASDLSTTKEELDKSHMPHKTATPQSSQPFKPPFADPAPGHTPNPTFNPPGAAHNPFEKNKQGIDDKHAKVTKSVGPDADPYDPTINNPNPNLNRGAMNAPDAVNPNSAITDKKGEAKLPPPVTRKDWIPQQNKTTRYREDTKAGILAEYNNVESDIPLNSPYWQMKA